VTAQTLTRRRTTRWLLALVLLAFVLRVWHLDFQSLWRDETDAIRFAQAPLREVLGNLTRPGWNGPLYFILLRGWLALVGQGEFAARYSSLIFGVLAVPLTWAVGRRLAGRMVAAAGAALVALSPYLIWYSQELKMYALVLALALLATYLYKRALDEGGRRWWLGHVVVASLMMYVHILAVLLLLPQALWFLVGWRRYRDRWRSWLLDMAALTLPYLPLALWQVPTLLSEFETGHPFYSLSDMVQILFLAFSRGVATPWEPISMALFLLLLLAGLTLRQPNSYRGVLPLALWLAAPVAAVYAISLGMPIFTDRYLIYVAPAYALILARGLIGLGRHWRWAQVLAAVLLIVFLAQGWWTQTAHPIKSDFRSAARLVAEHHQPADLILFQIPYGRYTFEYYYRQPFESAEGLYTNHGMSEVEAGRQMQTLTADRATVWLIGTEMEMWDRRHLMLKWLRAHGRQTLERGFARVTVWRFELD
jgi:4-amino-4-deoxy-L-arabinose transferase-like glycosyltransferase